MKKRNDRQSVPILRTKLFIPPVPSNCLERPRLYERLDETLSPGKRLCLVSALPGSGKTTLLAGWLHRVRAGACWLSLDPDDNDPSRFLAYLEAALRTLLPDPQTEPAGRRSHESSLVPLLNRAAFLHARILLVLDDYHVIDNPAVHETMTMLLERMPSSVRLIISARADPLLPVARLRLRNQLLEVRSYDLLFTADETAAYFSGRPGPRIDPVAAREIAARTEGWIAGIRLAELSQGENDRPGNRYVTEYMTQEVIDRQSDRIRDFLVKTSFLECLNGGLCGAVTGFNEAGEILARLERDNLFVRCLDNGHTWFRYHALFAQALKVRLERTHSESEIGALQLRASAWFESRARYSEAFPHALSAGDFTAAARICEKAARESVLDSRLTVLRSWLEKLPVQVIGSHPYLHAYQAWALLLDGKFSSAYHTIDTVRRSLGALPRDAGNAGLHIETFELIGILEVFFRGFREGFDGNLPAAVGYYREAREKAMALRILSLSAMAAECMAFAFYHGERLNLSAQACREVVLLGRRRDSVPLPLTAAGYIELAGICLERNDTNGAERYLHLGLDLCRNGGNAPILAEAYLVQSDLYRVHGDFGNAFEAIRTAETICSEGPDSMTGFNIRLAEIDLFLFTGRLGEAEAGLRDLEERASVSDFRPALLRELRFLRIIKLSILRGGAEAALAMIDAFLEPSANAGRIGNVMRLRLFRALALTRLGRTDESFSELEISLEAAEPENHVRPFLDEGAPAASLLERALDRGIMPMFVRQLLAAFGSGPSHRTAETRDTPVERLTPAETKVLLLLGSGFSNREIAERLLITLNTVKRHTNRIYSKLGVKSRMQAVVRAGRCRLLASNPVFQSVETELHEKS